MPWGAPSLSHSANCCSLCLCSESAGVRVFARPSVSSHKSAGKQLRGPNWQSAQKEPQQLICWLEAGGWRRLLRVAQVGGRRAHHDTTRCFGLRARATPLVVKHSASGRASAWIVAGPADYYAMRASDAAGTRLGAANRWLAERRPARPALDSLQIVGGGAQVH